MQEPERDLRDRADIEVIVRAFFRRAATDDVLGPVFAAARAPGDVPVGVTRTRHP